MMRKERMSAIVGIVAIVIIAVAFICFCKAESETSVKKSYKSDIEDTEENEAESEEMLTLAQKGYTTYQPLPESIQKLVDTNIFYTPDYLFYGEEEYVDVDTDDGWSKEELQQEKEEAKEDYVKTVERLKQIGTAEFLETTVMTKVTESWDYNFTGVLKYDSKTNQFMDSEKIAAIEACGFPGFSERLNEVAKKVAAEEAWSKENNLNYINYGENLIYYPGVTFRLLQSYSGYFQVDLKINCSACYVPEKYRGVIDGVTADGKYFLYASCVGGDREVLVFCLNSSICYMGSAPIQPGEQDEKKLIFVFEDGKLVDYYFTTSGAPLKLDAAEQKILDAYTKGTGKELSKKATEYGGKCIWRAR